MRRLNDAHHNRPVPEASPLPALRPWPDWRSAAAHMRGKRSPCTEQHRHHAAGLRNPPIQPWALWLGIETEL